jgi:hypothetical protein
MENDFLGVSVRTSHVQQWHDTKDLILKEENEQRPEICILVFVF